MVAAPNYNRKERRKAPQHGVRLNRAGRRAVHRRPRTEPSGVGVLDLGYGETARRPQTNCGIPDGRRAGQQHDRRTRAVSAHRRSELGSTISPDPSWRQREIGRRVRRFGYRGDPSCRRVGNRIRGRVVRGSSSVAGSVRRRSPPGADRRRFAHTPRSTCGPVERGSAHSRCVVNRRQ